VTARENAFFGVLAAGMLEKQKNKWFGQSLRQEC